MFYIPDQENSQYSQGFRKLIKRVLSRIKKQELSFNLNPQEKKNISSTMDYDENFVKRRKQLSDRRKNLLNIKEGISIGTNKMSTNKILLPKLQTPKQRMGIRGQELSSKFIRSSDKQIRKLLHQMNNEMPNVQNSKNIHYSVKRRAIKGRKIKSECIEQSNSYHKKTGELEQIAPWALNSTSTNNFNDQHKEVNMF